MKRGKGKMITMRERIEILSLGIRFLRRTNHKNDEIQPSLHHHIFIDRKDSSHAKALD